MHQARNDHRMPQDATMPNQGVGDDCRIGGVGRVDTDIVYPSCQMAEHNILCHLLGGPATLGKHDASNVGGASENAGPFHGFRTLKPRRHVAGLLQRRRRIGIQVVSVR